MPPLLHPNYPNLESHFPFDSTTIQLATKSMFSEFKFQQTNCWYHSPAGLLVDLLIIAASPTPPRISMTEAVSSPSNLGTRCGLSTGTSVDPCMVRPIKDSPEQVTTCLHEVRTLSNFSHDPQKRPRTLRFRLLSAQIRGSGSPAI